MWLPVLPVASAGEKYCIIASFKNRAFRAGGQDLVTVV
jgi:hypothetical protein